MGSDRENTSALKPRWTRKRKWLLGSGGRTRWIAGPLLLDHTGQYCPAKSLCSLWRQTAKTDGQKSTITQGI